MSKEIVSKEVVCVWMNLIDDTSEHFRVQFTAGTEETKTKEHDVKFPVRPNLKKPDNREQMEYAKACISAFFNADGVVPTTAPPKVG